MGLFKVGLSFSGFAIPLIYEICMAIDAIIYEVADRALRAFFEMAQLSADVQAYSTEIGWILQRVMVLAGVYALFRIAVMLINYLVNPNKISEASKNGSTIVKNIIIAVVLLISSTFIFEILGQFQGMVIEQNVIPKIVYGYDKFIEDESANSIKNQSARFVNNVFLLFFVPEESANCGNNSGAYYCQDYIKVANAEKRGNGYYGVSNLIGYAFSSYFTYTPFVSGIVGMMLVYYFAVFAIELGKRIIKLVVLQVISPVPIIMSIDPGHKDSLNKFVKAYSGVYLQVFIRIITMYLAFVILSLITTSHFGTDAVSSGMLLAQPSWFVKVLLYIGVFQAAKELPKLIEDAIGVKMGEVPGQSFGRVLTGILGGTAGLVGGTVGGAIGGASAGAAGALGGALAGGVSGMFSGATKAAAAKNAVAAAGGAIDSIKGSYALGGKVAGVGGLGAFMIGGAENFFGGKRKDEATSNAFDKQLKDKDKEIEGFNKKIGDINKDIGAKNDLMSTRDRADQLRSRLEQTMEKSLAAESPNLTSADAYLNSRSDYREMLASYESHLNDETWGGADRASMLRYESSLIDSKKAELTKEFEAKRTEYFDGMFDAYGSGTHLEFEQALEEYNAYVSDHGMSDRTIGSYTGSNDGIKAVEAVNEADKQAIQQEIEEYQKQIKDQEVKIQRAEDNKKRIENNKKEFENTPEYARRNKREEPPKPKPRDVY